MSDVSPEQMKRHLKRMRRVNVLGLGVAAIAAVVGFVVPHVDPAAATPGSVTLAAYAVVLWIGFTANRDSRPRLERIRRAFAVHGRAQQLLDDHLKVYLAVLARLAIVIVCGMAVAVWGRGPVVALPIQVLAALLVVMTWPTEDKARLLLRRALEESEAD